MVQETLFIPICKENIETDTDSQKCLYAQAHAYISSFPVALPKNRAAGLAGRKVYVYYIVLYYLNLGV